MENSNDVKKHPLKRKDLGIAGAVIVLAEAASNFQSSRSVSTEVIKMHDELTIMKVERDAYFVKKTELANVMKKIDKMNDSIVSIDVKVGKLKQMMNAENSNEDLVGCAYEVPKKVGHYDL